MTKKNELSPTAASFLTEQPFWIDSGKKGPISVILGGIHGNESCGVYVIHNIMQDPNLLSITQGKVFFLYGNIKAIQQQVRHVDYDLNRMFFDDVSHLSQEQTKSYAYQRMTEIRTYLRQADALLDLHSVSNHEAQPFVICEKNGLHLAQQMNVAVMCSGLDEIHPGGTDGYMNQLDKIGICLEAGQHDDPQAITRTLDGIKQFLKGMGHCDEASQSNSHLTAHSTIDSAVRSTSHHLDPYHSIESFDSDQTPRHLKVVAIYKNQYGPFTLAKNFKEFELIHQGQLIGYDENKAIHAPYNAFIMFAQSQLELHQECYCLAQEL